MPAPTSLTGRRIFLDHNSTTRPLGVVLETVAARLADSFANPGSLHSEGRRARRVLEDARESIASILNAQPQEVIFTSGGSESINLAVRGLVGPPPGIVAMAAGEHPATRESVRDLQRAGYQVRVLGLERDGRLRHDELEALPWPSVRLVTIALAHNETGVIQQMGPLAERCWAAGAPLHIDAVQAVGKISVDFAALRATALSLGAHKFHGPRGIGALLVREGAALRPQQIGGHQEAGRRAGTEPVALAAGMAVALEAWQAQRDERQRAMRTQRDRLERGFAESCAPIVINGAIAERLPNTSNVAFPGVDGEALLVALDLAGIACSMGSTCASGSTEPAPVLLAMGLAPELARSSIRFSVSFETTSEEIDEAVRRIADCLDRLRRCRGFSAAANPRHQALLKS
jgi:cysteine desulfurase